MGHLALGIPEQQIGDPLPLGARQPGGDKGGREIELLIDVERTSGEKHGHHGDAGRLQPLEGQQILVIAALEIPIGKGLVVRNVAEPLGIGILPHDQDGDIGLGSRKLTGSRAHLHMIRTDGGGHRIQHALGTGEITAPVFAALPGQAPAPHLLAQIVGGAPSHQHPALPAQGQDPALVLEQHQRLAYRLPGQRLVLCGAKLALLARQLSCRRHGFLPQPGPHLDPQDARHGIVDPAHRDLPVRHAIE